MSLGPTFLQGNLPRAPRECLPYLFTESNFPGAQLQSRSGGSRSGDDATVMIYIPFYGSCMQRCVRMVCCSTPPPMPLPSRRRASSIGHVSSRRHAQKCRRQTREPQSLFKPPASRTCPARHSARPPRPSDNGDLQPATSRGVRRFFGQSSPLGPLGFLIVVVDGHHQPGSR